MAAIADGWFFAGSTTAETNRARFFRDIFNRRELAAFVAAIAERLFAAQPAGAPKVRFSSYNIHSVWKVLC